MRKAKKVSLTFSEVSATVGVDKRVCRIPSPHQVREALAAEDWFSIVEWNRFCPSPMSEQDALGLKEVRDAFLKIKEVLPP